jgi:hypothetical protein
LYPYVFPSVCTIKVGEKREREEREIKRDRESNIENSFSKYANAMEITRQGSMLRSPTK